MSAPSESNSIHGHANEPVEASIEPDGEGWAQLDEVAGGSSATPLPSPGDPRPGKRRERSGTLEALVLVVLAFVLALTLKTYVAEAYEIKGRSMEPTFGNGQRVVVLKAFYGIERGDIVVFSSVEDPGKDLIKRVVGLPGERLQLRSGEIYVNGEQLQEEYVLYRSGSHSPYENRTILVPNDRYYVLGDNRPDSHDSRYFDSIPVSHIKGKVVMRWWPFSEFRSF